LSVEGSIVLPAVKLMGKARRNGRIQRKALVRVPPPVPDLEW
jgi:hypothetical protein